jgi:hypothetical protein
MSARIEYPPALAGVMRASVTGLDLSIPFLLNPRAGNLLLYGVGAKAAT